MEKFNKTKTLKMAKEFGISRLAAIRMRARFLFESMRGYATETNNPLAKTLYTRRMLESLKELHYLEGKMKIETKKDGITDEMIERARETPIETLIDFKNGKALAWCHEDKRPSLTLWKKGNKATCWVCNKRFDPISVLMERDGMSFIEAVKELN